LEYTVGKTIKNIVPLMISQSTVWFDGTFIAVLIEHTPENFRCGLHPIMVAVLPISEKFND
jgi:threonyl-tRNA synthetase